MGNRDETYRRRKVRSIPSLSYSFAHPICLSLLLVRFLYPFYLRSLQISECFLLFELSDTFSIMFVFLPGVCSCSLRRTLTRQSSKQCPLRDALFPFPRRYCQGFFVWRWQLWGWGSQDCTVTDKSFATSFFFFSRSFWDPRVGLMLAPREGRYSVIQIEGLWNLITVMEGEF